MKKKIEQLERRIDVLSEMMRKHLIEDNKKLESKGDMKFATLNSDTINSYFGVQKPEIIRPKFKLGDYVITKSGISGRIQHLLFKDTCFCYCFQGASVSGWKDWYLESELSKHEIVEVKPPMRDCQSCSVTCSLFCDGCPRGANWKPTTKPERPIDVTTHSDKERTYLATEKQMIDFLKREGYKIFKQTTTLEEV